MLLVGALVGWWWSLRMADEMDMGDAEMSMTASMSMAAYVIGWMAMMAAMMLPAIAPVVRLYGRAAARGTVAPLPFFVVGYLAVWSAVGVPAYFAWRALASPLDAGDAWVGRLAGAVLIGAAAYQLSPMKLACLHHCRSPMSFLLSARGDARRPIVAARLGATHGAFCLGCCWALMAILVAVGTMHVAWMGALALLIFAEKVLRLGPRVASIAALVFAGMGALLLVDPSAITTLT